MNINFKLIDYIFIILSIAVFGLTFIPALNHHDWINYVAQLILIISIIHIVRSNQILTIDARDSTNKLIDSNNEQFDKSFKLIQHLESKSDTSKEHLDQVINASVIRLEQGRTTQSVNIFKKLKSANLELEKGFEDTIISLLKHLDNNHSQLLEKSRGISNNLLDNVNEIKNYVSEELLELYNQESRHIDSVKAEIIKRNSGFIDGLNNDLTNSLTEKLNNLNKSLSKEGTNNVIDIELKIQEVFSKRIKKYYSKSSMHIEELKAEISNFNNEILDAQLKLNKKDLNRNNELLSNLSSIIASEFETQSNKLEYLKSLKETMTNELLELHNSHSNLIKFLADEFESVNDKVNVRSLAVQDFIAKDLKRIFKINRNDKVEFKKYSKKTNNLLSKNYAKLIELANERSQESKEILNLIDKEAINVSEIKNRLSEIKFEELYDFLLNQNVDRKELNNFLNSIKDEIKDTEENIVSQIGAVQNQNASKIESDIELINKNLSEIGENQEMLNESIGENSRSITEKINNSVGKQLNYFKEFNSDFLNNNKETNLDLIRRLVRANKKLKSLEDKTLEESNVLKKMIDNVNKGIILQTDELSGAINPAKKEIIEIVRWQSNNLYIQIESLMALMKLMNWEHDLPEFHGWTIAPDFARYIAELILTKKPDCIVSIGSGSSDVIVGRCLQLNDKGKLYSLEHLDQYFRNTKKLIDLYDVSDRVDLIYSPITKYQINSQEWSWYDFQPNGSIKKIDLLIVDGPPSDLNENSRYPAVPLLQQYLHKGSMIILDDGKRNDEKQIAEKWAQEYDMNIQFINNYKGAYILTKN